MDIDISFILYTSIVTTLVAAIFIVFYLRYLKLQDIIRQSHYDLGKSRAELDLLRDRFEGQIYDVTKKLTISDDRWRELYHILLTSQKDIDSQIKKIEMPKSSQFLRDMGLKNKDMKIDDELIFVLTPFHQQHNEVFDAIQNVCSKYGFKCLRGDEEYISGDIFPHLLKNIVQARLIIANIDGRNPNVFYELGIAHAIDKPVILVSKSIKDIPFDVKSKSIILFKNITVLRKKLKEALIKLSLRKDI